MALTVAITISVLYPPLALFCVYLTYQASFLKSRVLIMVLTSMMMTNDLVYPLARLFFYFGYVLRSNEYFWISSVLTGLSESIGSMVIWIFACKMWAVG